MEHSKFFVFAVAVTIYLLSQHPCSAQELKAILCNAQLPTARDYVASLYDGNDTIYLFGGASRSPQSEIQTLKYSISQDTLAATEWQPPFKSYAGGIVKDKIGNIYYLVGGVFDNNASEGDVWQYFPDTESFNKVSSLHNRPLYFGLTQPDEDTALIIGGGFYSPRIIQRLNLTTLSSEKLADMPSNASNGWTSAIFVEQEAATFIFGLKTVFKFDSSLNLLEILPNYFPAIAGSYQAVWDGSYGYIIGGSGSDLPSDSIIQFDPDTGDIKYIPVIDYPGLTYPQFHATSAVYVKSLNRIYMFGGIPYQNTLLTDKIWYISLDPIGTQEPPTTTEKLSTTDTPITTWGPVPINCVGLGDAIYPFPGNCEKFVLCRNDHAYGFDCPEPLLFHQTGMRCTWPDLVVCG